MQGLPFQRTHEAIGSGTAAQLPNEVASGVPTRERRERVPDEASNQPPKDDHRNDPDGGDQERNGRGHAGTEEITE